MKLSGWGRYPVLEARTHQPRNVDSLRQLVISEPNLIARGNGRSYGDSAINTSATIDMLKLNRMLAFDPVTGQLVAEAGVLLADVISVFMPCGWFPMVTPGTKFITLGGAIAADVHGKNHHKEGSFRTCVDWIEVMLGDGSICRYSQKDNPIFFDYTLGGMGLTGIIVRAAIRLRPVETAWIRQTTVAAPNLKAAMHVFEDHHDATYSVAWIDGLGSGDKLGRSIVMLGEHASCRELPPLKATTPLQIPAKRSFTVPVNLPAFALNRYTVGAYNTLYYWAGARKKSETLVDWDGFFYPLDAILDWNRIYGRDGFAQFQCALPTDRSKSGLTALLSEVARQGSASFLAVLKRFGKQVGAVSFPMEGYTLALDFPVNAKTLALLERLDRITIEHGGRFYLAKDSRMSPATFHASDRRIADFRDHREKEGHFSRFQSAQTQRLAL
jgi:decaprenylphospho-beta-D-ribofuranose 2-oxidase